MSIISNLSQLFLDLIAAVVGFLWGDLFTLTLPGGSTIGISLLVLILIPAGIYFTIRTRFVLPRRLCRPFACRHRIPLPRDLALQQHSLRAF